MLPVGLLSGLMNNTPLVAMYLPILGDWCRRLRLSPSRLFIPLSFAAIFGGALTEIGTSSNIVILEMLLDYEGQPEVVISASSRRFDSWKMVFRRSWPLVRWDCHS